MADTFRALCAELLDEFEYQTDWSVADDLKARARAALASTDEPAVPDEGREPAAVTGQSNWRKLCEELLQALEGEGYANWPEGPDGNPLIKNARAVLARWGNLKGSLTSSPPADGEVEDRAAELLQRQALVPVPVSERLPGSEDCDEQGRCWAGTCAFVDTRGDRDIDYPPSWELREVCAQDDVWLPAHALPLPEVSE